MELVISRKDIPDDDLLLMELDAHFPGRDLVPYLESVEKLDPMFVFLAMEFCERERMKPALAEMEKDPGRKAWQYFFDARAKFCKAKCQNVDSDKHGVWILAKNIFDGRARKFLRTKISELEGRND